MELSKDPTDFANDATIITHEKSTDPGIYQPNMETEPPMTTQGHHSILPPGPLGHDIDDATLKAIAEAQNQYGTRTRILKKPDFEQQAQLDLEPLQPTVSKKRPAPRHNNRNGLTGTKNQASKRQKLGVHDEFNTAAFMRPSPSPSNSSTRNLKSSKRVSAKRNSNSNTPVASSPPPSQPSPADFDNASEFDENDPVFCICRRPDDHKWMIGCDGGCEDWFHGKCVSMKEEDSELVDKYICPICQEAGRGLTTWKPMCRRDGCRKPARLKKGDTSKYCSRECGLQFFREAMGRSGRLNPPPVKQLRSTAKLENKAQDIDNSDDQDPDLGPLGGSIRVHELNALASAVWDVSSFRRLGFAGVLTAPASLSPELSHLDSASTDIKPNLRENVYVHSEKVRLDEIFARKGALRLRRKLLKDREKFVTFVKERAVRVAEKVGQTPCGLDGRLSWDEETFRTWRTSEAGLIAYEKGRLNTDLEEDELAESVREYLELEQERKPGKVKPKPLDCVAGTYLVERAPIAFCMDLAKGLGCSRHQKWQKLAVHDVRFEEADVGAEMRRIDTEEGEIIERARLRALMTKPDEVNEEAGSVEVVVDSLYAFGNKVESIGDEMVLDGRVQEECAAPAVSSTLI